MATDPNMWGPRLAAYIDDQLRARAQTVNAWTDQTAGISNADLTRWRAGTEPTLPKMIAVAEGLPAPLADLLGAIGVAGNVVKPEPPSIDVALRVDPTIHDDDRALLRSIVDNFREVRAKANSLSIRAETGSRGKKR